MEDVKLSAWRCFLFLICIVSSPCNAGKIEPIDDLYVGVWSPFVSQWVKTVPVCIWSKDKNISYRVIASGVQSGKKFLLSNEISDTIPYAVFWDTGNNLNRHERLFPNRPSKRSFSYANSQKCGGRPASQLRVHINNNKLNSAPAAIYHDTLLLVLSPL